MSRALLVCGLPRSGLTMACSILDRLGASVVGYWPSWEIPAAHPLFPRDDAEAVLDEVARGGGVVKWANPHVNPPPLEPDRRKVLWLTRSARRQAASQLKLFRAKAKTLQLPDVEAAIESSGVDLIRRLLRAEDRALRVLGQPDLALTFEDILLSPVIAAEKLAEWAELEPVPPTIEAAAAVVVNRSPECLEGFLEASWVDEHTARMLGFL